MRTFIQYLQEVSINKIKHKDKYIDIHEIESLYEKAHFAVQIVQMYEQATRKELLQDITTIANLTTTAFGLYNSEETKQMLPPNMQNQEMIGFGKVSNKNQRFVPMKVLGKYLSKPELDKIKTQGVIRVNVKKIMNKFIGDDKRIVLEIAATIVHECTHEIERRDTGNTSEGSAQNAERMFLQWAETNWNMIAQKLKM